MPCSKSLGAPRTQEDSRLSYSDRLSEGTRTVVDAADRREAAECDVGLSTHEQWVGWQPSRFLADRAEAERAYALAEQLGSVNAVATQLGTTWPSLRKAFTRHGLGMPARNPEAIRQRAVEAARQRSGQPVAPPLDPVFIALNPNVLPARPRSPAELPSGSAATRSTPPWAPTWSWS